MTLQEQIEVVMENIDTPIANSGSLQIARQIIRKQSEALKVAKEAFRYLDERFESEVHSCERCGEEESTNGWDNHLHIKEALATIEEMEK